MTKRDTDYDAASKTMLEFVNIFKETSRNFIFNFLMNKAGLILKDHLLMYTQKVVIKFIGLLKNIHLVTQSL
jgi:hypothetical protein